MLLCVILMLLIINPILKATSIVKGGVAEVDKFATATPTKDFTEANVATESK